MSMPGLLVSSQHAVCWCRVCERIATLTNLEMLAIEDIRDADAALEHLTALSKLNRLSIAHPSVFHISLSQVDSADSPVCLRHQAMGGPLHLSALCSVHTRSFFRCLLKLY